MLSYTFSIPPIAPFNYPPLFLSNFIYLNSQLSHLCTSLCIVKSSQVHIIRISFTHHISHILTAKHSISDIDRQYMIIPVHSFPSCCHSFPVVRQTHPTQSRWLSCVDHHARRWHFVLWASHFRLWLMCFWYCLDSRWNIYSWC